MLGKTGTMTTEEMEVHSFFAQKVRVLNSRKDSLTKCELDERIQKKIVESICWNSSAWVEMSGNSFCRVNGSVCGNGSGIDLGFCRGTSGSLFPT